MISKDVICDKKGLYVRLTPDNARILQKFKVGELVASGANWECSIDSKEPHKGPINRRITQKIVYLDEDIAFVPTTPELRFLDVVYEARIKFNFFPPTNFAPSNDTNQKRFGFDVSASWGKSSSCHGNYMFT